MKYLKLFENNSSPTLSELFKAKKIYDKMLAIQGELWALTSEEENSYFANKIYSGNDGLANDYQGITSDLADLLDNPSENESFLCLVVNGKYVFIYTKDNLVNKIYNPKKQNYHLE